MEHNINDKAGLPVNIDGDLIAVRNNKTCRVFIVIKAVFMLALAGVCIFLTHQVITSKQYYDGLLNKYTDVVTEKANVPTTPVYLLSHRAADGNVSYTYTTTTLTQGTTITLKTTPFAVTGSVSGTAPGTAPDTVPTSSGTAPGIGSVFSSRSATGCGGITTTTKIITVTIHDSSSSPWSSSTYTAAPVSGTGDLTMGGSVSAVTSTIPTTRITTTTVYVTASGLVTPTVETKTLTETATSTEVASAGALSRGGTSATTVDAVSGADLTGYGAASTTASYTLTIPSPSWSGTGFSGTGSVTAAHSSSTSTADPVSASVVTVSSAHKAYGRVAAILAAAIAIVAFHF